jgi:hypothetical protein
LFQSEEHLRAWWQDRRPDPQPDLARVAGGLSITEAFTLAERTFGRLLVPA